MRWNWIKKNKKLNSIISSDYDFKKLKIKAIDSDDLTILSSLCQDGIFSVDEIVYLKEEKKLIATFSRFCWELKNTLDYGKQVHFRVVTGLQIHNVININYKNFEKIIPNNLWGTKPGTSIERKKEVDFMHFQGPAHKILSSNIYNFLQN